MKRPVRVSYEIYKTRFGHKIKLIWHEPHPLDLYKNYYVWFSSLSRAKRVAEKLVVKEQNKENVKVAPPLLTGPDQGD